MDLHAIRGPQDLRGLTRAELDDLAAQIRRSLVDQVSRTGGHLGPNLGVVELTLAVHRVFDSPRDAVVFDTGHQAYVHKMVTGRQDFSRLRREGGLSGYPSRAESEHDIVESSHASSALSWADGIAQANRLRGHTDRHVVAVVGDGALTGGMSWEALNNIAAHEGRVVIVVNDNERSYAPTIGGLAHHLDTLRTTGGYERFLEWGKRRLRGSGTPGRIAYDALHGVKKGIKDVVAPQGLFEDLGLKYVGPVDGHDVEALEHALGRARAFGGPVIVHAITQKGRGYAPAENDEADRFHGVPVIDPLTGVPVSTSSSPTWTQVFGDEIVEIAGCRPDVVGITAAMLLPVGFERFAARFPERVFDVGIAEQHAVTSAAGMAFAGLHPVVAVYSTFLNRAIDQVLMDVALHRAGVTLVLDRAGITGEDGPSHHGMWDISLLSVVPGIRICAPRDAATLRQGLRESVEIDDGPTVVRFPKGAVPAELPVAAREGAVDVLRRQGTEDVLLVSVGALAGLCLEVADALHAQGIGVTVVDPRWVLPVDPALPGLAARHRLVVVVEDAGRRGGVSSVLTLELADQGIRTPVRGFGIPPAFLDHGTRAAVLERIGLTAQDVARGVVELMAQLDAGDEVHAEP